MCYKKGKSSATLQKMVHLLPLKRSSALLSSFPLLNETVTSKTSEDLIMHWRNVSALKNPSILPILAKLLVVETACMTPEGTISPFLSEI